MKKKTAIGLAFGSRSDTKKLKNKDWSTSVMLPEIKVKVGEYNTPQIEKVRKSRPLINQTVMQAYNDNSLYSPDRVSRMSRDSDERS